MAETASRRSRALLAGGAVLGLGTVGTLAIWADSEFATSLFGAAPSFIVQSAADAEGPFDSHDGEGDAARLQFDFPSGGLAEGEPVTAEFWLRMGSETTGSVSVLPPTVQRDDLDGRIDVTMAEGTCAAPGEVLQDGFLENLAPAPDAFVLPGGAGTVAGEAQPVCITATLTDTVGLAPGNYSTGDVVWEFAVAEVGA